MAVGGLALINQNGSHPKKLFPLFIFWLFQNLIDHKKNLTSKIYFLLLCFLKDDKKNCTNLQEGDLINCDSYEIWVNLLRTTTKLCFTTSKTRGGIIPPQSRNLEMVGEKNLGHNRKNHKPIKSCPGVSPLRATSRMQDPECKNSSTTPGPLRKQ